MITEPHVREYLLTLGHSHGELLETIEQEALAGRVPVIRRETQDILETLIAMIKPLAVLEVGTAVGFSTLLMRRYMPAEGRITTIESYESRIRTARENFHRAGEENHITLLEGDAEKILKTLEGPYDLIFMDAAKGQYIHWLPEMERLVKPGGILLSDNVLQEGEMALSRYAVARRDRTIHTRLREYLWALTHSARWKTSVLPLGDGLALSWRAEKK